MSQTNAENDLGLAIEKKLLAWLAVALLIVAVMAGAAIQNNNRQAESAAWVAQTHAFILENNAILSSLHAAEAAQRTYILTGDDATRQLSLTRFAEVDEHLQIASRLALENPAQRQRLATLTGLLQKQIDANKESARLRALDPARAAEIFTNATTRANLVEIQRQIAAGKAAEDALLHERDQKLTRHTTRTKQILALGGALNVVLLGFAFYVVRLDLNLRRRAAAALQAANESLEVKVRERTAELADSNEKLQIENLEQQWGQAALRRLVRHHELLFNSIREAIFVISRNGHIISSNAAAATLTGLEGPQLAGKSIATILFQALDAPPDWEKHILHASVKLGAPMETTRAYLRNQGGAPILVRVACHPTRDQENLTGAVITVSAL
jgi:PAS domain S-box-containing protein